MLVLSRRQNDKIVFPHLGVTVEILRISGRAVRIGVRAPADVSVLRHEVAEREGLTSPTVAHPPKAKKLRHRLRNRLNTANLALHLLQRQLDLGLGDDAEKTLQRALDEFRTIDQEIEGESLAPLADGVDRPCRALLVEDDANESELLAGFLRICGFAVDCASDGSSALDHLATRARPDVVLLDMHMPRCDGPTMLSAIRSDPQYAGLKVFAVSATAPRELGVPSGPQGVDRWFSKPVNPQVLVAEMRRDLNCPAAAL